MFLNKNYEELGHKIYEDLNKISEGLE
ncbi:hypothetical protein TNCV_2928471, partial [Trichonephila clavipes]